VAATERRTRKRLGEGNRRKREEKKKVTTEREVSTIERNLE
jgi:hypothetical protein